jgi:predicted Ser/Thr protein kinase
MDLGHIIVSMKGDKAAKVECRTCKKTHAFKVAKGATEPKKPKVSKAKKKAEEAAERNSAEISAEWAKLMNAAKGGPKNYSPKSKFILGEKIKHTKFGEGVIHRMVHPNKIEVIFETDLKLLIHGGM